MLSVNTNGIKRNGRNFIEKVVSQYHVVGVQETKFRDAHHLSKFSFHLSSTTQHRLFISDKNASCQVQTGPRSGGVATLLHPDLPGVERAEEVSTVTIPGRYLLVHIRGPLHSIYIQNVYAPVRPHERAHFFQGLPTQFEPEAHHVVLGDFNVAVDPILDSRGVTSALDPSRGHLLGWLATLRVADPWRLRFTQRRLFSGPRPRINRLDYIFVSDELVESSFETTKYFQAPYSGDHLAVRLVLGSPRRRPSPGYWRLRPQTLDDDGVRRTLIQEIHQLQTTISSAINPRLVWEGWKRRIKSQLRLAQASQGELTKDLLAGYRQQLADADRRHLQILRQKMLPNYPSVSQPWNLWNKISVIDTRTTDLTLTRAKWRRLLPSFFDCRVPPCALHRFPVW